MSDNKRPPLALGEPLLAEVIGRVTRNLKAKPRGVSPWASPSKPAPAPPRADPAPTPRPQTARRVADEG